MNRKGNNSEKAIRLLCFLFLSISKFGFSQTFYSTRPDYLSTKNGVAPLHDVFKFDYPDTTITYQADIAPRNFLGATAFPTAPYFLGGKTPEPGFIFFRPSYASSRYYENDLRYHRSVGPYASLNGIAGAGELQMFKMFFTQTFRDKLNLSVDFDRYTNTGFYKSQRASSNNLAVTANQELKNQRFGYYLYFINNTNKNNENGGLTRPLTDTTVLYTKMLLPVSLRQANRLNQENILSVNPYWRVNSKSDSLHRRNHYVQLQSKLKTQSFNYRDKDLSANFYKDIFLDSNNTNDSVHLLQFTNGLDYTLRNLDQRISFSVGWRNEITQYWQLKSKLFLNDRAQARFTVRSKIKPDSLKAISYVFNVAAATVFSGYNQGDYKLNADLSLRKTKNKFCFISFFAESRKPDYFSLQWAGNNFSWNNNFSSVQTNQLDAGTRLGRFLSVSCMVQSVTNFIYYNREANPEQYAGTVLNHSVKVNFSKVFFRHLGIGFDYQYQASTKKSLLRFPDHVTAGRIYYSGILFKRNLQLNIGAKGQVYSNFTPYDYMPATQLFYLQDGSKTGSYPYVDLYLSARIRPVSFFVTLQNVLRELAGKSYFLVPGYYQPERALRFGLTWIFFD